MELQCSKGDLVRGVQAVERAVSAKGTIQVLTGIHIEAGDSGLTLTATDLELGIQYTIPAQIMRSGAVVLESRYFGAIARRLPEDMVHIQLNEDNTVSLKSGKAHFSVLSISARDFPGLPRVSTSDEIEIDQKLFSRMISKTVFAASRDDTRPVLTGVLLEIDGDEIRMVATDGNRLSLNSAKLGASVGASLKAIVPARGLAEINRLLTDGEGKVSLVVGDGQVQFSVPNGRITTRLIEGQYPNYQQVFAPQYATTVQVSRREWLEALERASLISREGLAIVILSFEEGILSMKAQESEVGQVEEQINSDFKGDSLTIAFQVRFLIDALKVIDCERVEFKLNGSTKPGCLVPITGDGFQYVVMPVRVAR